MQGNIGIRQPLIVAVCGDSGSGKTTLTDGMVRVFGQERIQHICLDDYHLLDRTARLHAGISALHPDANNLTLMTEQLQRLAAGESVVKPVYDHTTGTFSAPEVIHPTEIIIVHGLHPLFTPALRQIAHVRIYLDPEYALQQQWKIIRDSTLRGYTVDQVRQQIADRRRDSYLYIQPQKRFADMIVRFSRSHRYYQTRSLAHLDVRMIQPAHAPRIDLSDVIEASANGVRPALRLFLETYNDIPCSALEIDAEISHEKACELEDCIWAHMAEASELRPDRLDQLGLFYVGNDLRQSDSLALTQLILLYHIISARHRLQNGETLTRPQ
ncbi:MAG TPA: phosphoribulokinase [Ktedonobacteraceae bacterium]|jgi:phosphoribulokinase|nr:phosphoribulokinase [Ktedonobacteraceae bacterium]